MTEHLSIILKKYVESYLGLSKSCWQGIILNLIESTYIGIYYFLPLYFVSDLKFNIATSGFIISFYGIGTVIGGFLGGKLSDIISARLISIMALLFQALILLALTKIKTVHSLMVILFIMGTASYSFISSNHTWVLSRCHSEVNRLKAINLLSVASNFGLGLSAVIISLFVDFGYHKIFLISSGLLFVSIFYFVMFGMDQSNPLEKDKGNNTLSKNIDITSYNHKIIIIALISVFLVGLIIFQSNTTYSIYIKNSFPEYGIKGVGFLFALNCFLVVFFQAPIITILRKMNMINLIASGALLLGFSMVILNYAFIFSVAIISCLVETLGEMMFFSSSQLVCYQGAKISRKGQMLGLYRSIYACSRIVAPSAGSIVYIYFGGHTLWYVCGCIGIFCFIINSYSNIVVFQKHKQVESY